MEAPSNSLSHDRWGAPVPDAPAVPPQRRRRRLILWGVVVALGLGLVVACLSPVVKGMVVDWLAKSCRRALQAGDMARVERLAGRWHAWAPNKAAPLIYLAEVANQAKDFDRAAEWLDQLPDDDPLTPPALLERSSMLFDPLVRPQEGAATLERLIKLAPTMVEARRRLIFFDAFTLQRHKMIEQAYDAIRNDCDLPETYIYLMLSDILSFANAYEQNTKWSKANPNEELFIVARALYRIKTKALDEVNEAQTDGPPSADGTPYHKKVIEEHFQRFPNNLELVVYFLDRAMTKGDVDEVERLLARDVQGADLDNRIWRCRGWLHGIRGQLNEAEQCYQKALSLVCYDHRARHYLASIERRLKRLDLIKPLEDLSFEGKELRAELLRLPTVDKVPVPLLRRMSEHAKHCGDQLVAEKLSLQVRRLEAATEPVK